MKGKEAYVTRVTPCDNNWKEMATPKNLKSEDMGSPDLMGTSDNDKPEETDTHKYNSQDIINPKLKIITAAARPRELTCGVDLVDYFGLKSEYVKLCKNEFPESLADANLLSGVKGNREIRKGEEMEIALFFEAMNVGVPVVVKPIDIEALKMAFTMKGNRSLELPEKKHEVEEREEKVKHKDEKGGDKKNDRQHKKYKNRDEEGKGEKGDVKNRVSVPMQEEKPKKDMKRKYEEDLDEYREEGGSYKHMKRHISERDNKDGEEGGKNRGDKEGEKKGKHKHGNKDEKIEDEKKHRKHEKHKQEDKEGEGGDKGHGDEHKKDKKRKHQHEKHEKTKHEEEGYSPEHKYNHKKIKVRYTHYLLVAFQKGNGSFLIIYALDLAVTSECMVDEMEQRLDTSEYLYK
eukprot:Gb_26447 [translate_table: standard]